eukprot:scaffold231789_cov33-Tisochrysis_lutea.AAC.5
MSSMSQTNNDGSQKIVHRVHYPHVSRFACSTLCAEGDKVRMRQTTHAVDRLSRHTTIGGLCSINQCANCAPAISSLVARISTSKGIKAGATVHCESKGASVQSCSSYEPSCAVKPWCPLRSCAPEPSCASSLQLTSPNVSLANASSSRPMIHSPAAGATPSSDQCASTGSPIGACGHSSHMPHTLPGSLDTRTTVYAVGNMPPVVHHGKRLLLTAPRCRRIEKRRASASRRMMSNSRAESARQVGHSGRPTARFSNDDTPAPPPSGAAEMSEAICSRCARPSRSTLRRPRFGCG